VYDLECNRKLIKGFRRFDAFDQPDFLDFDPLSNLPGMRAKSSAAAARGNGVLLGEVEMTS
jgi:hypothetical protein